MPTGNELVGAGILKRFGDVPVLDGDNFTPAPSNSVGIDGSAPGADHGANTDANGRGVVNEHRLYQVIRESGGVSDYTFDIGVS